ncbi:MAG: carbon starvation CstA family protein [Akkermansia sp.]
MPVFLMNIDGTTFFVICILLLIVGHFTYGRVIEKIFRPKASRITPAIASPDGVDYVPLPGWKIFFIQLLNIAGLGPVYGAILGALYGPIALLWITFGCILGGAVHDYLAGMISLRHGGISLPEIIGRYLGKSAKFSVRYLCISLIVLVGVVFALGPAELLGQTLGGSSILWAAIIFIYYFAATVLPMDTIIGRIYPFFAVCLVLMAGSMLGALFMTEGGIMPDCTLSLNQHPGGLPIWPMLFITIACGAISGFHATQSPMMARCMKSEMQGRSVFFGPMITEGIIALIWCAAGLTFYKTPEAMNAAIAAGGAGKVVFDSSGDMLGHTGRILAVIGVVVLPITSGDTALRSARLMIADSLHLSQKKISPRLFIAVPLLAICLAITAIDFDVIWRYFGWLNQCIACFTLWAIAVFLRRSGRFHWVASLPAIFLTAVCITYGFIDKNCLNLPHAPSAIVATLIAISLIFVLLYRVRPFRRSHPHQN